MSQGENLAVSDEKLTFVRRRRFPMSQPWP